MTNISGTCASKVQSQTMVSVQGKPDHQVGLTVMLGQHKSPDPKWNDAMMTYVGTADLVGGNGQQTGYFYNAHPNGDISHGTFQARVTTGDTMTVEGTRQLSSGSGTLANLSGGGNFKAQMTSPTNSEMTWSGNYQLG
jgi:hypothetical protein